MGEHEFNGYPSHTFDSNWELWKVGDKIVWESDLTKCDL